MDKIYINLNPKKTETENLAFKNFFYYINLGIFFSLVIIVVLGLLFFMRFSVYRHYATKWGKWKNQYTELSKIKKEISTLENEKNEFKKVITPKIQIAKIFEDIFASLPQNIWFSDLSFKQNLLSIKGYVVRVDEDYLLSIEKFIDNLEKKEYFMSQFSKINIRDSQKKDFNGIEVLEFALECAK